MAGKRKKDETKKQTSELTAHILGAGEINEQDITYTLENNYMPYAMSVILSRAIPEIDGFKPSHRKLLYTMYLMGLLKGDKVKSANIVGRTMQLNPHGDQAIYETMVRLTRANETLLHPYIDSKGNFGKAYSKNMQYAASRYTEAKLDKISAELFADIDKDTVDFVPNYDNSMTEPTLFPVRFPSILVNSNMGIAVGMASNICSFNLNEVCRTAIELIKNPDHVIADTLKAPDFSGGGRLIYDRARLEEIYETGRGAVRIRSKYEYDKKNNCIDITEIPPTTTSEAVIEKIIELNKTGKLRDISDIRDETDKSGLKITIDLKRGTDPEKLMNTLFKKTPLEDSFSCNFNILIGNVPKVIGVREILGEWTAFRSECIKRKTFFELEKAKEKLHLLLGLKKILLDIDKAIKIVRETEEESEVVPNLMIGFGIDEAQAEYVAEIKLRHLNREYILKRLSDIDELQKNIEDMEDILKSRSRIKKIIVSELEDVSKKYGKERRTEIIYVDENTANDIEEEIPDYPVKLFFTKDGYFKKITPLSLRMSSEQKLKDGDEIVCETDASNADEILFFTNKRQVYKTRACEFSDTKASVLGDFVSSRLEMDKDELPVNMTVIKNYTGYMLFVFENGKIAKIDMSAYETKTNRKKLIKAYSDKSPLVSCIHIEEDADYVIRSTSGRYLIFNSGSISPKSTKDSQGVAIMTLKKGHKTANITLYNENMFAKPARYRTKTLPAAGSTLSGEDSFDQISF